MALAWAALFQVQCERPARAQTAVESATTLTPCPEENSTAPRRKTLWVENVQGVWFRLDVARCILGDLKELPVVRARIKLLDEQLRIRDDQVKLYTQAAKLAEEEAKTATGALDAALRRARESEDALNSWTRSRTLWASVGVVVTVAVVLVGAGLTN